MNYEDGRFLNNYAASIANFIKREELNHEKIESAISDRSTNHKYKKNNIRINIYRISIDVLFWYFKVNDIYIYIYVYINIYTYIYISFTAVWNILMFQ